MPKQTFTPDTVVRTSSTYSEMLSALESKIDSVKREISYFDVYNITTVTTDPDAFPAQISALPFGQSLVINTESSFNHNQVLYNRGDILLKLNTGQLVHIKSQTGGIYYPSNITTVDGAYALEYSYSSAAPVDPGNPKEGEDSTQLGVTEFAKKIRVNGLKSSGSSNIYGNWDIITQLDYNFEGRADITPMIQFFFTKSDDTKIVDMEEVVVDYDLSYQTEGWTASLPSEMQISTDTGHQLYAKVK